MAKIKYTIAGPDDPIFKEGWTISTHRKNDDKYTLFSNRRLPKCDI